jgi:hypothetical protein
MFPHEVVGVRSCHLCSHSGSVDMLKMLSIKCKVVILQYQCEQLDKTFRYSFFNGSLVPGSQHASIPSLCGMLEYNDVTSIETRMVPEGRFEDNQWCLSNVRVALIHEVEGGNR